MMPAEKTWSVHASTVKLTALASPICNSRVYWLIRPKIWGTKAAMVSVRALGGIQAATSRPSWSAMSAPATPGRVLVRLTMSLGVQLRLSGSLNNSARLRGVGLDAGGASAGAGASAGIDLASGALGNEADWAAGAGADAGGAAGGLAPALNRSGIS